MFSFQSHGALIKTTLNTDDKTKALGPSSSLKVTSLGRLLADLPVEFSLGRMLIVASLLGVVEPVLTLVAGMSVQAPLVPVTSLGGSELARRMEALSEFESDHGDAFTVMNVFDEWLRVSLFPKRVAIRCGWYFALCANTFRLLFLVLYSLCDISTVLFTSTVARLSLNHNS